MEALESGERPERRRQGAEEPVEENLDGRGARLESREPRLDIRAFQVHLQGERHDLARLVDGEEGVDVVRVDQVLGGPKRAARSHP